MANEELNEVIQQLADIGTLVKQFSGIATEMSKGLNKAISSLNNEKSNIEESVKSLTSTSGKWESKFSSASNDVSAANASILALTVSISNIKTLFEERVQPVNDLSTACTSISEKLDLLNDSVINLNQKFEAVEEVYDTVARLGRIEQAVNSLVSNQAVIISKLSSIDYSKSDIGDNSLEQ